MPRPHLDRIELSPEEQSLADRLYRHVDMLAGVIGERHVWRYDYLMAAEKYVRDQLSATGLAVTEQAYTAVGKTVRNLIAEQPGVRRPEDILILGAHYDSVEPTPGADDNASAVAGLLEVARLLAGRKFKRTIRYVAFVNEEPPFYKSVDMGSYRYARDCRNREERIRGMINLEMIGYFSDAPHSQDYPVIPRPLHLLPRLLSHRANFIVICSDFRSLALGARFAFHFRRHARFPTLAFPSPRWVMGPDMSDHWSFWEFGYPALMVTDTSFFRNNNYHKRSDTPDTLHYPAMSRIVQGTAAALARLAGPV